MKTVNGYEFSWFAFGCGGSIAARGILIFFLGPLCMQGKVPSRIARRIVDSESPVISANSAIVKNCLSVGSGTGDS